MKKILTYTIMALCAVGISVTFYAHQSPPKHSNLVAENLEALAQGEDPDEEEGAVIACNKDCDDVGRCWRVVDNWSPDLPPGEWCVWFGRQWSSCRCSG